MKHFLIGLLVTAIALFPAGAQNGGYPSDNYSQIVEDFYGANFNCATGSTVAVGPWTLNCGGTAAAVASVSNATGAIRLTSGTSNLANARAAIGSWDATPAINRPFTMGRYATAVIHVSDVNLDDGYLGVAFTYDNNVFGVYSGAAKGFGFLLSDSINGSNWIATWANGSAGSSSNTAVAGDDSWLRIVTDGSTVKFSAASGNPYFTSEITTTTNLPASTDQLCFGLFAVNSGTAVSSTTMDIDFVSVTQKRWP